MRRSARRLTRGAVKAGTGSGGLGSEGGWARGASGNKEAEMWGLGKGGAPGRGEGVGKALPHPEASNRIQGKCARPGIKPRRTLAPSAGGFAPSQSPSVYQFAFYFPQLFL